MLKKIAFALSLATKLIALTCSNVTTMTTPGQDCNPEAVAVNENGDIAAVWAVEDDDNYDETLYSAVKKRGEQWGPSSLFVKNNDGINVKQLHIDSSSDIRAVVELDQDEDDLLQWGEKKWGASLATLHTYPKPSDEFHLGKQIFNRDGKWVCIGEVSGNSSPSNKIVVATASPGQTEVAYTTLAELDRGWVEKKIIFGRQNRAAAAWIESTYDLKSYKRGGILKMAFEKEDGTWTAPEIVSQGFDDVYRFKMKGNTQGDITIAWTKFGSDDIQILVQHDGKWSEPAVISYPEQHPRLSHFVLDSAGNLLVIWEGKLGDNSVFNAAYRPVDGALQASVTITPASTDSWFSRVMTDNRGNFVLVWDQKMSKKVGAIFGATFSTREQKWSTPVQLSPAGQSCGRPQLALSNDGKGVLSWMAFNKCCERFVQVADLTID